MNNELREIKNKIFSKKDYLLKTYGVEKIGIFGSFARNEATNKSDLDVLITLKEPISYFKFFDLEKEIELLVGKKIDLATNEAIKSTIRPNVMKDLIFI